MAERDQIHLGCWKFPPFRTSLRLFSFHPAFDWYIPSWVSSFILLHNGGKIIKGSDPCPSRIIVKTLFVRHKQARIH